MSRMTTLKDRKSLGERSCGDVQDENPEDKRLGYDRLAWVTPHSFYKNGGNNAKREDVTERGRGLRGFRGRQT